MTASMHLDDASVEAVARRVADLLRGEGIAGKLIDTVEVARRFNVSRDFVYDHADDLGAIRLGSGPKARLRFDPVVVAEQLATSASPDAEVPHRANPKPRRRKSATVALLPVRGSEQ